MLSAEQLIELAITRSDNHATDALLAAIGRPQAVTRRLRKAGVNGIRLDRDIATLVRDDGEVDPARSIDVRDSTTPQAMAVLLAGLYQGQWLSPQSREVLLGAMSRCRTGIHRLKAMLPSEAMVGHKTGTLSNTSSDVGLIRAADGRTIAIAIYVTGQGGKPGRDARSPRSRARYEGYQAEPMGGLAMGGPH
jgi:beta-lactamase class A